MNIVFFAEIRKFEIESLRGYFVRSYVLRRIYRPKRAMSVSTWMNIRKKKSSGTTNQANMMMTWRTWRLHLKSQANRAKMNTPKCKHRSLARTRFGRFPRSKTRPAATYRSSSSGRTLKNKLKLNALELAKITHVTHYQTLPSALLDITNSWRFTSLEKRNNLIKR